MTTVTYDLFEDTTFTASSVSANVIPRDPDLTRLPNGDFLFAYGHSYDQGNGGDSASLRYDVYTPGNTTPLLSGSLDQGAAGDQTDVALTTLTGGRTVVVYVNEQFNSAGDIYFRLSDNSGVDYGAFNQIVANNQSGVADRNPDVAALANGSYVVVWDQTTTATNADVRIVVYGSNGVFSFSTSVDGHEFILGDATDQVRNPVVAGLTNGNFVVAFQ